MSVFAGMRTAALKGARCARGGVAIMFALSIVPLIAVTGMAVEYNQALNARTKLQTAADSAALAAARLNTTNDKARIKQAKKYFRNNYSGKKLGASSIKVDINATEVVVKVKSRLKTKLLGLLGINRIPVAAESTVPLLTAGKAELVLVLDYSDSMLDNSKYIRMRDAANSLIDDLTAVAAKNSLKVGLVPFAAMVYADLPKSMVVGQSGSGTWTGCTQDRRHPINQQDQSPNGDEKTKFGEVKGFYGIDPVNGDFGAIPGHCALYEAQSLKVLPLTTDTDKAKKQLNAMVPHALTHIAAGVEFGWHLLSPNAPYSEGVSYTDKETKKIIVILTDGMQTGPAWGAGDSVSASNGETNWLAMCKGMKAKKIQVFTIGYDLNDTHTLGLLESCADKGYYFNADELSGLETAFEAIGAKIKETMLRLSK